MKKIFLISLLSFIFSSNIYAYVDMSLVRDRSKDLNMTVENYTFSMALSGMLTGTMFGLFLWKSR